MNLRLEPVAIVVGGFGTIIAAGMAVLTAFGLNLSAGETSAVMGLVGAVSSVVLALFARSKVDSPVTVDAKVASAVRGGPPAHG